MDISNVSADASQINADMYSSTNEIETISICEEQSELVRDAAQHQICAN